MEERAKHAHQEAEERAKSIVELKEAELAAKRKAFEEDQKKLAEKNRCAYYSATFGASQVECELTPLPSQA